jgi:ribosomal protein L24
MSHHPLPDIKESHFPEDKFDVPMLEDTVCVVKGPYTGRRGIIDWIYPDEDWMWISAVYLDVSVTTPDASVTTVDARATTQNVTENLMVHCDEVVTSKPAQSLTFSHDKGYNVSLGDTLQVVRGEHHGTIGIVRRMDFLHSMVELVSDIDAQRVSSCA